MKTSMFAMYAVFMTLLLFYTIGCNNRADELQRQNTALQGTNAQLSQDLNERDDYVGKITDSINAIYASMEDLKTKESSLVNEEANMEANKKLTHEEIRARLTDRITLIHTKIMADNARINKLHLQLAYSKRQYAGLVKLVDNLKKTLAEREQSIADLSKRVQGLEQDVTEKNMVITEKNTMINQKDSVIDVQHTQITTSYYIAGTKDELEKLGIIKKEGGFPWGLFGSTTTLASGFDWKNFKPINNTTVNTIQVDGKIDEIIPKRDEGFYREEKVGDNKSSLIISVPVQFWEDKYLVIITDRPTNPTLVTGLIPIVR